MLGASTCGPASSHVTALFNDGPHSFLLPQGSTLAELADRIAELEIYHEEPPIAVHVYFVNTSQWRPAIEASASPIFN